MSTLVRASAQLLEDAELVLHLGAAGDEHEGPLDVAEKPSEHLQLLLEEKAGVRRQQSSDALRRGVSAVRGAERVVDEDVHPVGEPSRRLGIVLRLAGVEAGVLEHGETLVRDQLAQALGNRRDREGRIGALRPPEVRADRHVRGVPLEEKLERRQRRPDARVVRDAPVLERHVEIGADEDLLPRDVSLSNRARPAHGYDRSLAMTSTSRHE